MDLSRLFEGRKFMWDGRVYGSEAELKEACRGYQDQGFEVRQVEEAGQYYLFSRRAVKEVKAQ